HCVRSSQHGRRLDCETSATRKAVRSTLVVPEGGRELACALPKARLDERIRVRYPLRGRLRLAGELAGKILPRMLVRPGGARTRAARAEEGFEIAAVGVQLLFDQIYIPECRTVGVTFGLQPAAFESGVSVLRARPIHRTPRMHGLRVARTERGECL